MKLPAALLRQQFPSKLVRGAVITKIDKEPVTSAATAKEKLEKANLDKGVLLQVRTPRGA